MSGKADFVRAAAKLLRSAALSIRTYWPLLVLAVALSTALWVAVTDAENPPRTETFGTKIPVAAVNVPDDLAISGGTSLGSTTIRITAREDIWDELTAANFTAVADFANQQQGEAEVPIRVDVADDLAAEVTILDYDPATVTARLERRVEQSVRVRVNITGQPPIGFTHSEPLVDDEEVTITGPEALVRQVVWAEADVNLSGATVDLTQSFRLVPRSTIGGTIDGVSLEPDSTVVRVEIDQTIHNRDVVVKPTVEGRVADGYEVVSVATDPLTVVVFGSQEALQNLEFAPTDVVDVTGATSTVTRTVQLRLPPDISSPSQPSVIVEIEVVASVGETQLGLVPDIINLGSNLDAALNTSTITVRLAGELPVLRGLRARDLELTVDVDGLGPGVYSLRPEIEVPSTVELVDWSPAEVTLTISRRPTPTPTPTATPTTTPSPTQTETPASETPTAQE
jgi:YbbR domain-containing protein